MIGPEVIGFERAGRDAVVLVPAAGAGVRLGPGLPKALRPLCGEPLLTHVARRLSTARSVGCLVVAAPAGYEPAVERALIAGTGSDVGVIVIAGGAQRWQSVALALAAAPAGYDLVLVHDAARALTPPSLVDSVAAAVRAGADAVIPVLPVTDTIVQVGDGGAEVVGTPDRATLRAVQTPQGFRRSLLAAAHAAHAADRADRAAAGSADGPAAPGAAVTDDAGLVVRLGREVRTIAGAELAMKITRPADFRLAADLLTADITASESAGS